MRLENRGGDVLARGGVRANFQQGSKVSQEKWDSIFEGFDAEAYRNGGNASPETTGDGSTVAKSDQANTAS